MTQTLQKKLEANFIQRHPGEAALTIQKAADRSAEKMLKGRSLNELFRLIENVPAHEAAEWIGHISSQSQTALLEQLETPRTAEIISAMDKKQQESVLEKLPQTMREAVKSTLMYPPDQAGSLMDRRITPLNESMTVNDAIKIIKQKSRTTLRVIFITNADGVLIKYIKVYDLLLASGSTPLREIAKPVFTFIYDTENQDDAIEQFEKYRLTDLPVVNYENKLIGVIRYKTIVKVARDTAMLDIQTMVGVSKEERALSSPFTVVKKRLPWLQINLLTAFLAAAVVGLFENVISAVTALAVLLPVVAGQSGNTGAQALAVTMRGIALREVFTNQWYRLLLKEFFAAFINGIAIALTTGLFVYLWSHSVGLVAIIFLSMIVSMVIAAIAGTSIPIILIKLGMDPAAASSIILTTITDVAGFFSFLGIASLLIKTIHIT